MSKFKTVARFTYAHEADMAKSFLDAHGVESFLRDQHTLGIYSFYSNALGGVRLDVLTEDYERAAELLKQANDGKLEIVDGDIRGLACPRCGSTKTEVTPDNSKGVALLVVYLTSIPLWFLNVDKWHCLNCDHSWSVKTPRSLLDYFIPLVLVMGLLWLMQTLFGVFN